MQRLLFRWVIVLVVFCVTPLVILAAPQSATTSTSFKLSTTAPSQKFSATLSEAGCLLAQIKSWSASTTGTTAAAQLALSVGVSRQVTQTIGAATSLVPLWTSLAFTSRDLATAKTGTVTVTMPALRNTSAGGTLWVEYPPTQTPCEFKASLSRTRGRVDLSWRYTGSAFKGSFMVQRSTDGRTWSAVSACARSASSATYTCSDTGLTSTRIYYYRACAVSSGTSCGSTAVTPPLSVRVP